MEDAALRSELEAVYNAFMQALKDRDPDAFLANTYTAAEVRDQLREYFDEAAASLLDITPELSQMTFVTIKTRGDDLAGYYTVLNDPDFVSVTLTPFLKVEGRWLLVLDTGTYSCSAEPGQDLVAKAKECIEGESCLQLEYPGPRMAPSLPPATGEGSNVQVYVNCMAYDHEVNITINGAPLGFEGGKSFSGLVLGAAPGAEPAYPCMLLAGENQFGVEYRKTDPESEQTVSVEVVIPPDRTVLRLGAANPSGTIRATFHVPESPADDDLVLEAGDET